MAVLVAAGGLTGLLVRGLTAAFRILLWIVMMFALAGCMVGPDFTRPKAPVVEQWWNVDGVVLTRNPAELGRWWETFRDPVLSNLIETAYRNNYSLKIAGLRVLEARAQLGIAVGFLYPQVQQANGQVSSNSASQNDANTAAGDLRFWTYDVSASVSWELDFWGKFRRDIESAHADLLGSIAAYDNVLVLLTAQVADTYVVIRTAEEQLRVARANVAIQQRSVEITEVRYRYGDVDELDLQQALTQLRSTQATIPQLEIGLQQASNALNTLLGRPPGDIRDVLGPAPGAIPASPLEVAMGAPADLLRRRPDVRQAELAAAAQSARVGVAESDLYPSFGLTGVLGVLAADGTDTTKSGRSGASQLFNANSLFSAFGVFFSWDIFNYGRLRNRVRVQDARLQQLLEKYQDTVLNAAQEVEDGMVAFVRSREQEAVLVENVAAAQRSVTLSTLRYREGLSDFQRVLDAQGTLFLAQQRSVSASSATVRGAIGIYRALGGGWEVRFGRNFVDQETKDVMQKRVNWGDLLEPKATEPPVKGAGDGWAWPDW